MFWKGKVQNFQVGVGMPRTIFWEEKGTQEVKDIACIFNLQELAVSKGF